MSTEVQYKVKNLKKKIKVLCCDYMTPELSCLPKLNIQWKGNSSMKTLPKVFVVLEEGSMIWSSLVPKERTHFSDKLLLFMADAKDGQCFRKEQGDSILTP